MDVRIGQGIDVHRLVKNESLIIGGVKIPFEKGSLGHSDGDVLFHAVTDAVLGSLALGDIGTHFPSDNDIWENADSSAFLKHAVALILENGWSVQNLDTTIILQNPQLSEFIPVMIENLSTIMEISLNNISVKATTTDHLGFIGIGDGICCMATVLIREIHER